MSRVVRLRPAARADLREIWRYTAETWGAAQAQTYIEGIRTAVRRIADNPALGSDRSELYRGLRKVAVGSHCIYYLFDDRIIDVVRILHNRMDADTAL